MADEITPETPAQPQVPVMVDERDMRSVYANTYRIHVTSEEVILDLGFNMPDPSPNPRNPGQPGFLLKITDRVVLNYTNTKRLAQSLGVLIKRYEQQFGEIPMPQRTAAPPR